MGLQGASTDAYRSQYDSFMAAYQKGLKNVAELRVTYAAEAATAEQTNGVLLSLALAANAFSTRR